MIISSPSMMLQMALFHSSLGLSNIPQCIGITHFFLILIKYFYFRSLKIIHSKKYDNILYYISKSSDYF